MILSISNHIYAALMANTALNTKVSGRIFPLGSKNEVAYPFVVYERTNVAVEYDKASRRYAEVDVSIYAVSDKYTDSLEIAELIADSLDKVEASYTGFAVEDAHIAGASENYIENAFVQTINFKFQITENNEH